MSIYLKENPKYLDECLYSLFTQTLLPSEIVIVKDGPLTTALESVLEKWQTLLPIKIVPLLENKGLGHALSVGLFECSNDIVARMDADDVCLPKRFETQFRYLDSEPNVDILGSYAYSMSECGEISNLMKVPISHDEIKKRIWTCPFIHPTVMFKRQSILNIGSYDPNIAHRQEDYELWIRSAHNELNFHNVNAPLIKYRMSPQYYAKNGFKVALNRFFIGLPAAWKYDRGVISFLGVCFPIFRCFIPLSIRGKIHNVIKKFFLD